MKTPEEITHFYVAVETYEDGCQKTTWRNFHENGHQHICVCGKPVDHAALDAARAEGVREGLEMAASLVDDDPARVWVHDIRKRIETARAELTQARGRAPAGED